VAAILIRNVASKPLDMKRLQKLQSLPQPIDVRVFTQAAEISDALDRWSTSA
jgi:hypothetical protein